MKSKIAAALLAFFLGSFGAHRFYLGQMGKGLIYLLFCWTIIPSIVAIVDCVIFATMDDQRFNDKYNEGAIVIKP